MKAVYNIEGLDISGAVVKAALAHGADPAHLLALLKAESGLNPRAERWGSRTAVAKNLIASQRFGDLQSLINVVWPDISFGYGQHIILYHYFGTREPFVENVMAVRQRVFEYPEENIDEAAKRLKSCTWHSSYDGTILSAFVIYNAGSDRRNEAEWLASWSGNVASYERALQWAEDYREGIIMDIAAVQNAIDVLNGWVTRLEELADKQVIHPQITKEMRDSVDVLKRELFS